MRILFGLAAILAAVSSAVAQQSEPPLLSIAHNEGVVETLAVAFPPPPEESGETSLGPAQWAQSFVRPGSSVVQLHLSDIAFGSDEFFEIEIVDSNGATLQKLTNQSLKGIISIWTDNSAGQSLGLAVYGNSKGSLRFKVDAISYDKLGLVLESIVGNDERMHLYAYQGDLAPTVDRVQGPVAKLSFIANSPNGPRRYVCTGFLIGDDTLVTNEHCVATAELCATTKVMFGFTFNNMGQTPGLEQYDCQSVTTVNVDLDMAVIKLVGQPGERWGTLKLAANDVLNNERIFVLQHPAGEAKQISDVGCTVFEAQSPGRTTASDFAHQCDTLGGSSGSPVFNVAGEVVGLHHWGRDAVGRYSDANRAVRIGPIKEFLASHNIGQVGAASAAPSDN